MFQNLNPAHKLAMGFALPVLILFMNTVMIYTAITRMQDYPRRIVEDILADPESRVPPGALEQARQGLQQYDAACKRVMLTVVATTLLGIFLIPLVALVVVRSIFLHYRAGGEPLDPEGKK